MKNNAVLLVVLLGLSAQGAAPASAPARHLVYQFGYNTAAASSGNGTGTETVDIKPAADGGLIVSAQDHWWNTARPRATNTCDVHPNGRVACSSAPNALSPIQLTLFPLLGAHYFNGLSAAGTSNWTQDFTVYAAVIPGASGFAGTPTTWKCSFSNQGKGPIANGNGSVLVEASGTLSQQGGRYWKASSKQRIAYDPAAKIPLAVRDVRTHLPQRSVYSNDLVELKLIKDSQKQH